MLCSPRAVGAHDSVYGAVVSLPITLPFIKNSTRSTSGYLAVLAVITTLSGWCTIAPASGDVSSISSGASMFRIHSSITLIAVLSTIFFANGGIFVPAAKLVSRVCTSERLRYPGAINRALATPSVFIATPLMRPWSTNGVSKRASNSAWTPPGR